MIRRLGVRIWVTTVPTKKRAVVCGIVSSRYNYAVEESTDQSSLKENFSGNRFSCQIVFTRSIGHLNYLLNLFYKI